MKKGFTLVELLAVISILAILAVITVISVNSIISDSENSLYDTQINNIKDAARAYYLKEGTDSNGVCVNVSELIEKGYIEGSSVIDTRTREPISGSIRIAYNSNQYSYEYNEKVCPCTVQRQKEGTYTVGDVVTCGSEKFYVISNDGSNIQMLTKYNLEKSLTPKQLTSYYIYTEYVNFSSTYYWWNVANQKYTVDVNYKNEGRSYPYVYNSNSKLYQYVEAYKNVLENMGINVVDAKLISYEQLFTLGCRQNDCSSAPNWVILSSGHGNAPYWTGSGSYGQVWRVYHKTNFTVSPVNNPNLIYGIRPVITISVSNI